MTMITETQKKTDYSFGMEESWVNVLPFPISTEGKKVNPDNGRILLFFDCQQNICQDVIKRYQHYCVKALTQVGTSASSQFHIDFIPGSQWIIIHSISVVRQDIVINKNKTCHLKIEQIERISGEEIHQGYKTLTLLLDDVRVGDEVSISFTLYGSDPVTKGHCAAWIYTARDNISQLYRHKVICPKSKSIYYRNFITQITPEVTSDEDTTTYDWTFIPEETPEDEDELPQWLEIYPYIEISDYKNWSDVVEALIEYYEIPPSIPPFLTDKISQIKSQFTTIEEQALACLQYVSNEIRYHSLNEPHLTYRPNSLETIVLNGFGDCKDKTFLLTTLLRMLDIETYPGLVSYKRPIFPKEMLPTFKLFDHIMVYAWIHSKPYWIDPTIPLAVTSLHALSQSNKGDALLLKAGENELTRLPMEERSQMEIAEIYDFKAGVKGPIIYTVMTKFFGVNADSTRWEINKGSIEQVSKKYHSYYRQLYPEVKIHEPINFKDDLENNILTIIENYFFPSIDSLESDEKDITIRAYTLMSHLKIPNTKERKYPLGINYPIKLKNSIKVLFSNFKQRNIVQKENIQCEVFKLTCETTEVKNLISRNCEYESLKDHVLPTEFDSYIKKMNKAHEFASFSFSKDILTGKWNVKSFFSCFFFWLIVCIIVYFLRH